MSKTYNVTFNWGEGYSGGDPTRWLTNQPVLNVNSGDAFAIPMLIGEIIEKEINFKHLNKLLGFLNVKYLLVRNDTKWEFLKGHGWWFNHQPEIIKKFIENQNSLNLEKEIGLLKFYKLKDEYLLPHIYSPSLFTLIDGEIASLADIAQFLKPEKKEAFVLTSQNKDNNFSLNQNFIWRQPLILQQDGKKDLSQAIYEISIKTKTKYEILLRNQNFWQFYQGEKKLKISLDNKDTQERKFSLKEDNLISLGEIELDPGNHTLTVFPPPLINLVDNPSFEQAIPDQEQSKDSFQGSYSLKLSNNKNNGIISLPIKNFQKNEAYEISFVSKHLQGEKALFVIWENYNDSPLPDFAPITSPFGKANQQTRYSKKELPLIPSWQESQFTFQPTPNARSIGLSFTSFINPQQQVVFNQTENLFDDLKVQRIFTNPLILKNLSEKKLLPSPPQISFKKISPVKYEIDVTDAKNPYILVFSESYHPNWTSSVEGKHFTINGFANAWQIEKTGNYKITLFYKPQNIYLLGIFVSLSTTITSLGYILLYNKLNPKSEYRNPKQILNSNF